MHLLKETKEYYISVEPWQSCPNLKRKKKNLTPKLQHIILKDSDTIKLLDELAWDDWHTQEIECNNVDTIAMDKFFNKNYPNKKIKFVTRLNDLYHSYSHSTFSIGQTSEHTLNRYNYTIQEYINELMDIKNIPFDIDIDGSFREFKKEIVKMFVLDNSIKQMFFNLGHYTTICPYIFPKEILECFDGNIYFIQTDDTIYYTGWRSI